ncbi:MAG: DUF1735 and LamG domain-containing protein [Porphyromonas sp.]|nr:DUF1735 and LamG domain-containing protein [Porphyromonas sp.]
MKRIIYTLTVAVTLLSLFSGCSKNLEDNLLEPKTYFEKTYVSVEVREQQSLTQLLQARVSTPIEKTVGITYSLGDIADVEAYNDRNGTECLLFPLENIKFSASESVIASGDIYASPVELQVSGLANVEEGKTFLIPIHFTANGADVIKSAEVMYLSLQKPIQIKSVAHFDMDGWWSPGDWISLPRLADETFESVTYEALIHPNSWGSNNTVMGVEGKLILRIGDEGGGLARNKIQIAGNKQFHYDTGLTARKWHHVAFTFDKGSGKAVIYINGKPVATGDWDEIADIREGFAIGQVPHFMWGTRPFNGYMAEVRLWNVARTEAEIQNNMLRVDPATKGLVVYYHLNGEDIKEVDGQWTVLDATKNGYNGEPNDGERELKVVTLETPLEARDL